MKSYPKLNLPPISLRATRSAEKIYVWDEVRRRRLLLSPEEWVRRHVVGWLQKECSVPLKSLIEEYPVSVEGMPQRCDIVVVDRSQRPAMLVECKAPGVEITASVLDQAKRYNIVLGAKYVMITNGLKHYLYSTADSVYYIPIESLGDFQNEFSAMIGI